MKLKIMRFLLNNGYTEDLNNQDSDYQSFHKKGCYDIDVGNDEVVLIDETGDWMHINFRIHALYTLLGVLLHYKQITMGYNWME